MTTAYTGRLQELYQIRLTQREATLLESERGMLTPLERQEKYILQQALSPVPCPACSAVICRRSAVLGGVFNTRGTTPDDGYECNFCHAKLRWYRELFGGQGFTLQPGQTITTR